MGEGEGAKAAGDAAERRRMAVLDAAGKLFTTKGFEGTTTLDIAREAGVSKRDLYAAFASKEAILGALISSRVDRMSPGGRLQPARSRAEALGTLQGYSAGLVRFLTSTDSLWLYRLAIAGVERQPAVGRALLDQGMSLTTDRLVAYAQAAVEAGHLKPMDVEAAVKCLLNVAIGSLQLRRLLDPTLLVEAREIEAQVERAMRIFMSFEGGAS